MDHQGSPSYPFNREILDIAFISICKLNINKDTPVNAFHKDEEKSIGFSVNSLQVLEPLNKGASAETEGTVQFFSFQQKQQTPWSGWGEAGKRPQAHSFFAST